jgi:hypothetical protein
MITRNKTVVLFERILFYRLILHHGCCPIQYICDIESNFYSSGLL